MSFQADLKFGQQAEADFHKSYPNLIRLDGRSGDFQLPSGAKIETKFDRYCPIKYKNFIIERYRSKERPGGLWQAEEHGCSLFCYVFVKTGDIYLFNTVELIDNVVKIVEERKLELHSIANTGYTTRFYKILRDDVAHVMLDLKILEET